MADVVVGHTESGVASWYGAQGEFPPGQLTANGEVFDWFAMTAAHKTLPFGTVVKVNNLDNGKSVEVRINDRGPYVHGRNLDLTQRLKRPPETRG